MLYILKDDFDKCGMFYKNVGVGKMSIKQRIMRHIDNVEKHMRQINAHSYDENALKNILEELLVARELCHRGLSAIRYADYGEFYDSLILATQQMLDKGIDTSPEEVIELCNELFQYIVCETKKEINFKKEIVFLPYKSSMWDSLESAWKAVFDDEEHCIAYVIPVPYADRNFDGSVAKWHCERDLFPSYVPTLDWKQVDLFEWHPDVIVFHNPYDDQNRVTSVEERFYSRNIRKCTEKLIYIPYFILEDPCTEASVVNFVLTPGVLNADRVIVQSEAIREVYVDVLVKNTTCKDRSFWEQKVSGIGSPKIDKVLTSRKEDFDMPEKWQRMAKDKKVILYNTSLSDMLQNAEKICDKLNYVFKIFRNRNDMVLWWRPHPLMKATLHSMRPDVEAGYRLLEKEFIEEAWGIFDDSADLHRAICWSDAYYGDEDSSVARLYEKTGKPMIMQNIMAFI